MANWPLTPAVDHLSLVVFEREAKSLVGQIHDVGYDDANRARDLLHKLVAMATDQLIRVERHERDAHERGLEERETSIPPVSVGGGF